MFYYVSQSCGLTVECLLFHITHAFYSSEALSELELEDLMCPQLHIGEGWRLGPFLPWNLSLFYSPAWAIFHGGWVLSQELKSRSNSLLLHRLRVDATYFCHILLVKENHIASTDQKGEKNHLLMDQGEKILWPLNLALWP